MIMSKTIRSGFRNWYGRVWHKRPGVARWLKRMLSKKRRKHAKMTLVNSYERGLSHCESMVNWRDT